MKTIRPNDEQAAGQGQLIPSVNPQNRSEHLVRRRSCVSSEHGAAICAITHEKIQQFPSDDIYTTLTGVHYHKPTLKLWLQDSDAMPHNNLSSIEDLRRLWPHVNAPLTTIVGSREEFADAKFDLYFEAIAFGALSLLSLYVAYAQFSEPGSTSEEIRSLANQFCETEGSRRVEKDKQCIAATVPSLWALDQYLQRRNCAVGAVVLGVSVCLIARIVHSYRIYEQKKLLLASIQNGRAMTDEEHRKADMGIDYYQASQC